MDRKRDFTLHLLGPFRLVNGAGQRVSIPSKRGMALRQNRDYTSTDQT